MRARSAWGAAAVAALGFLWGGCGGDDDGSASGREVFTGALSGTDAMVAIVVEDGAAIVFSCGGDDSFATHSRWFTGPVTAGEDDTRRFDLEFRGWIFDGIITGRGAAATVNGSMVRDDGQPILYAAQSTAAHAEADIYGQDGDGCRTGAIVLPPDAAHTQSWLQGTWCEGPGNFRQVEPVRPIEVTTEGLRVEIHPAGVATQLVLPRVRP